MDRRFPLHIHYSWKPPRNIRKHTKEEFAALRQEMHVEVTGNNIPPIVPQFHQMRLPKYVMEVLKSMNITKPTSIQMQCIPAILCGCDLVGISPHHSGKLLAYVLPLFLFAVEEELKLKVISCEGPLVLVVCSSREAASEVYSVGIAVLSRVDIYAAQSRAVQRNESSTPHHSLLQRRVEDRPGETASERHPHRCRHVESDKRPSREQ